MAPINEGRPPGEGRPKNQTTLPTPTSYTEGHDAAASYGLMMDRPLTTTRTCAGEFCWCHVGATVAWPIDHNDELARIFREIRSLEVAGGVVGL
jgi:hypothetical protein